MEFPWLIASLMWLVTDRQACLPGTVQQTINQVASSGIDVVVFRDKNSTKLERHELAHQVHTSCLATNTPLVVAHDIELALHLNAAGIHLGLGDPSIADTRARVGDAVAIGYSCHSIAEAKSMFMQGADYVFLGPIFASPEKLKYGNPLGVEVIRPALKLPGVVVFIGGMNETTVIQAVGQGAQRIAAIRAFQSGDAPQERVRRIAALLTNAKP